MSRAPDAVNRLAAAMLAEAIRDAQPTRAAIAVTEEKAGDERMRRPRVV
jgi:hypothetical protein